MIKRKVKKLLFFKKKTSKVHKKKSKDLIPASRQNFTRKKNENPQNDKKKIRKSPTFTRSKQRPLNFTPKKN
jgi:hypothetical protein